MKITVLGAGMIGSTVISELENSDSITHLVSVDGHKETLDRCLLNIKNPKVSGKIVDLTSHEKLVEILKDTDIAIGCLPHSLSLPTIQAAIEAGCHLVDLVGSKYEEKKQLHDKAVEAGIIVVPGMGVAPGIINFLTARGVELLDEADEAVMLCGGIPRHPLPPLWYQIVYRLDSVMGLYTRPALAAENGNLIKMPALSGLQDVVFPEPIGECEAAFSDAHSVAYTLKDKVNKVYEKAIRYKGHFEKIKVLAELGFLDEEPVNVDGQLVSPLKLTMALLEPKLKGSSKEDVTVLRVTVTGKENGQKKMYEWEMVDHYDHDRNISSMAKTTAMPAVIFAEWLAKGKINERGIVTPEEMIIGDRFEPFVEELRKKGIIIQSKSTVIA